MRYANFYAKNCCIKNCCIFVVVQQAHNINPNTNASEFDYVYQYKDHLGNIRINYTFDIATSSLKVLEENHYYPFGLKHTASLNKRDIIFDKETQQIEAPWIKSISLIGDTKKGIIVPNSGYQHKYNSKSWEDELGINVYDYGARNYDPALGRWMNIDPLAEGYEVYSPYNYAMNNPIYFVDPDGKRIKIGDNYYSYNAKRDYDKVNEEERGIYQALDKLYSSGAMNINFGTEENPNVVNVLDKLIELDTDITVALGEEHEFQAGTNTISFSSLGEAVVTKSGVSQDELDKAAKTGKATKGVGFNSATSQHGHELVHAYNYNFDRGKRDKSWPSNGKPTPWIKGIGFYGRKHVKYDFTGNINEPYYSNEEEKYTTTLSNQINKVLGEAIRWDYRAGQTSVPMQSVTSNVPLKVSAND